ncbi:tRNA pseudouridine synthase A isoform X2 [Benincasa hispida]|uniref:tRNA pseudouridine synthase A isoform X2 n=1 Tax=Benincasa hispida TaxID=102211 RepID=UPI001902B7A4|nr:tRNA pseudouridine synthase A isoform X2 [Benincasa hispida]
MTENQKHGLEFSIDSSPQRPLKIGKTTDEVLNRHEEEAETMNRNPGIQRYLVAVEYIGTRFSGSQQQPNCRTVVGALEEAFQKFIGQPVSVFCSSRTDAGVHALSNVCHVDVERISKRKPGEVLPPHEPGVVHRAVNHFLQKHEGDVTVVDVRSVPNDFHARYKAQERTYFYRLVSGPEALSSFEKDRAWHVSETLNIGAMQDACKVLVGHHDFSSFRAAGCQANSPIRTLDELDVCEVVSTPYFPTSMERKQRQGKEGDSEVPHSETCEVGFGIRRRHRCFVVTARARSFLYHQVRLMVGVLKAVGTGDLTVGDVERILEAKNVNSASPMAPACGLYLGHVRYDLPPAPH